MSISPRGLAENPRCEKLECDAKFSHVSLQFTVFAAGIRKRVGVDHESLKSDTCELPQGCPFWAESFGPHDSKQPFEPDTGHTGEGSETAA